MRVSERLRVAVFLDGRRAYELAYAAGLHPSMMSKLLRGAEKIHPNDPRILKIGALVGLAASECFEVECSGNGQNH
jgi:hypothetical protein